MSKARPPSKNQLLQIPSKVTGSKAVTPLSSHTWHRSWVTGATVRITNWMVIKQVAWPDLDFAP